MISLVCWLNLLLLAMREESWAHIPDLKKVQLYYEYNKQNSGPGAEGLNDTVY